MTATYEIPALTDAEIAYITGPIGTQVWGGDRYAWWSPSHPNFSRELVEQAVVDYLARMLDTPASRENRFSNWQNVTSVENECINRFGSLDRLHAFLVGNSHNPETFADDLRAALELDASRRRRPIEGVVEAHKARLDQHISDVNSNN